MPSFDVESLFAMSGIVIAALAVPFLVIYVLGNVRREKADNPDRFLGARVFLLMMISLSFQITLVGLFRVFAESMDETDDRGGAFRGEQDSTPMDSAVGILLGGLISAIYPTVVYILVLVRDRKSDKVFRGALGVNAIICGVIFVLALTFLMASWMADEDNYNEQLAATLVYLFASLLCGLPLALAVPAGRPMSSLPPPPRY